MTGVQTCALPIYHESKKYTRRNFKLSRSGAPALNERAYAELWRRTPRPVLALLERANSEQVRKFAVAALKTDFRASLREVEAPWVVRLISVQSATVDEFVIWLLQNVPKFEQGGFRDLGLHEPVLRLLDSSSDPARVYAAAYARTHARDLELGRLLRLANNSNTDVRKLAADLLGDRDPRKDIGLDAWGQLLGTQYGHDLAATALRKHFSARELTPAWFADRLLDERGKVFEFASDLLLKVHTHKSLGSAFFRDLLDDPRISAQAARFALDALTRFPGDELGRELLEAFAPLYGFADRWAEAVGDYVWWCRRARQGAMADRWACRTWCGIGWNARDAEASLVCPTGDRTPVMAFGGLQPMPGVRAPGLPAASVLPPARTSRPGAWRP